MYTSSQVTQWDSKKERAKHGWAKQNMDEPHIKIS